MLDSVAVPLTTRDHLAAGDLQAAERAVHYADDWIEIARAWLARRAPAEARRCAERAIEGARGEHWPIKYAAEIFSRDLGDRDAAVAALARIETRRPGDDLRLARAHRELLGDEAAVDACLARAAARPEQVADLAELAAGRLELRGDQAGARGLLERAEALARARGELRELWGVANVWKDALMDEARAAAALELATQEGTDLYTVTAMAMAWRCHFPEGDGTRRALVRAETLAVTSADWLRVAEAYRDGGDANRIETWDPEAVRRCLEAALVEADDDHRVRIEAAFRTWLADDDRADAILLPSRDPIAAERLEEWARRDPGELLDRACEAIDDEALKEIALADYGYAWPKHLAALERIRATRSVPAPLDWHPQEVLALTRWGTGQRVNHVARAFACIVLLVDHARREYPDRGAYGDTLGPLLESAWRLGWELEPFLVWLVEVQPDAGWPIVALMLDTARKDAKDARLEALRRRLRDARLERGVAHDPWGALVAEVRVEGLEERINETST